MNTRLGDLYSLKNHPYDNNLNKIKIAGLASMTPPIVVVSEILNSPKQYDTDTGIIKSGQVRCIFYSHKNHKFENLWFNTKDLKLIEKNDNEVNREDKVNDEIVTKDIVLNRFDNPSILKDIKNEFLNKQVILNSCDLELGKLKTTFSQTEYKSSDKITAHLDFLPPVLTVIDVKLNDEKIGFNPKSGNLKKITSVYLLKCKWYNSLSGAFSEDFIPINTVQILPDVDLNPIKEAISNKNIFRYDIEKDILKESTKSLKHIYVLPLEIIFNHYKYEVRYYDIFRDRFSKMKIDDVMWDEDKMIVDDLILDKIPEYKKDLEEFSKIKDFVFEKSKFYRIIYRDLQGNTTKRIIYVKEFIKDKVVIADCLLRNGEERHFRIDENAILKLEVLNQDFFI